MKVVVAESISSSALDVLRQEPGWIVVTPDQISGKLNSIMEDADALIVRSATTVDAAVLKKARKLRVIGRAGVGVDNVDLDAATKKGIAVMNTPGASAIAVAEHALALMLSMARNLCRANEQMHAGRWGKKSLMGTELRGKVLGIIGLGKVGIEVARRARAFGMELVAHDPFISADVAAEEGVRLTNLEEVFALSDYLTLHVGLTAQTAGMINATSIRTMKAGLRLVNCARGELVDEPALVAALMSGHIAGAALDVFAQEPPQDSRLTKLENVICTPHIAGSTFEAQENIGIQIAMQVREYLKQGVIQNAVNVPSVSYEEYLEMQPYIVLAERLGAFLAQATEGNLEEMSLRYSGKITTWKTDLVRNAAIQGALNQMLSEKANLVNAASIAESRGIRIVESKRARTRSGDAAEVLTVSLKTSSGVCLVRGAVLHRNSPRLLAMNGVDIEVILEGHLLYLLNRDVPGVVGRVGTVLAENGINIANFSLARSELGTLPGLAIAVVRVDSAVPDSVLQQLRSIEAVVQAKAITL